jgi:hypothetical protein
VQGMTAKELSILDIEEIRRQAVKWADLSGKTERITLHLFDCSDGRTKSIKNSCVIMDITGMITNLHL